MPAEDASAEARRFVAEHISSVAQLEMLLLLRTNPSESWTASQMAREMRMDAAWAEARLKELHARGLLERSEQGDPAYRYQPRTPELERAVTAVSRAYLLQRVSIIELIYSKPSDSIRVFADAFRLKKDRPNE